MGGKEYYMEMVLENESVETAEDIKNIMKGLDDVEKGRVMDVDSAMKKFFIEREVWKSIK